MPPPISLDGVLRFREGRTGSFVELAVKPPTPLRVCIHGRSAGPASRFSDLRVLLVADVLTRIAELGGLQVIAVLVTAGLPTGAFEQDADALSIHPTPACASAEEAEALLGRPADVHVAGNRAGLAERRTGVLIDVGRVDDMMLSGTDSLAAEAGASGGNGCDLLALRLTLLARTYRQPVRLTQAALADAEETLNRWRRKVAEWADQPSRPMPAETARKLGIAFDDDINTVAAMAVLRNVESSRDMPAGAKFETFVFADRVLGLELVREIGRPR